MDVTNLPLPGVKLFTLHSYPDARGFFIEHFKQSRYAKEAPSFVQDNLSYSKQGVIRGMHFQKGQAKLVSVICGKIYDVFVDIRLDSPTFGKWGGYELDSNSHQQLLIPDGFAHGFAVISQEAYVLYKVSTEYDPSQERSFRYDDPTIGIKWPLFSSSLVSARDAKAPLFTEVFGPIEQKQQGCS